MECDPCKVKWRGCADVFECPVCGKGTPPWNPEQKFDGGRRELVRTLAGPNIPPTAAPETVTGREAPTVYPTCADCPHNSTQHDRDGRCDVCGKLCWRRATPEKGGR